VVDHEAAIRELAAQTLATYGYRVLTAAHGTEAIALCRQHANELHVMIVAAPMPVMDSPSIVQAAREISPRLHVILTSSSDAPQQAGESAIHLPKPYTPDDLLHAIHQVLSAQKTGDAGPR
jgi:CheY-like chemotaxis protein